MNEHPPMNERWMWSMGTRAQLVVEPAGSLDEACRLLRRLERLWSRFIPGSDVVRMNSASGRPVRVAPETADLIRLAQSAHLWSRGLFDPTVADALVAAGYDRTFEAVQARGPGGHLEPVNRAPGPQGIVAGHDLVLLPRGVHVDLGGIGKGRAADLGARALRASGAAVACVNLGGDIRVIGDRAWPIEIEDPLGGERPLLRVLLRDGALATSSTMRRRWRTSRGSAHHLIDPRTGNPCDAGIAAVTAMASDAAWAEVCAKAVLIAGLHEGLELAATAGLAVLIVTEGGELFASEELLQHLDPTVAVATELREVDA